MELIIISKLFETKGLEYLIVIGFLLVLIPFWLLINRPSAVRRKINRALDVLSAQLLRIPGGLFYSKNHAWAHLEKSGNARVGLNDFLLQVVGPVQVKQLLPPGSKVQQGEVLAQITQNGKQLSIPSPITGVVVSANEELIDEPELLLDDPYTGGWLYALEPENWKKETGGLYLAEEATRWISSELERFKDFLSISLARHAPEPTVVAFQEGGELRKHIMTELDEEVWNDFQQMFLNP